MTAPVRPLLPVRFSGFLLCVLAALGGLAGASRAADDETPAGKAPAAKAPAAKARDPDDHLDFKKTYAAALLEARIRNVPVFVSRHKDF